MKVLVALALIAIAFIGTTFSQTQLRPLETLVAGWVGLAASAVLWLLVILAFLSVKPLWASPKSRGQTRVVDVPGVALRVGIAVGILVAYFLGIIAGTRLLLSSVTVPRTILAQAQRQSVERELGFKLSVQDLGKQQRVHFLRKAGRDVAVTDVLSREHNQALAPGRPN